MILITGATGVVGRETVRLLAEGGAKVAAVTRDPSAPTSPRVTLVHPTGGRHLPRLEAVLLSPRAVGAAAADLLARARETGTTRVVVLSAGTVQYPAGLARFRQQFQAVEDIAKGSGLDWTILRCADFAANSLAWAGQIRATGMVRGAYPRARTSTIDERDIAAVAALALTRAGAQRPTYLLTGEQSLSQPEKVAALGAALGRTCPSSRRHRTRSAAACSPPACPTRSPTGCSARWPTTPARPDPTTDTVRRLLGRPARTYATWAQHHRAAFTGH